MLPIPVHERAREKPVVFRCHPVDERKARIIVGRQAYGCCAQAGWRNGLICFLIRRFGQSAPVKDKILAGLRTGFAAHLREERSEAVIVVLTPLLVGMMVALRALQSLPQEKLRRVLKLRGGIPYLPVPG